MNPKPEITVKELLKKVENGIRASMDEFIGQRMTPDVVQKIANLISEKLASFGLPDLGDFKVEADPADPTALHIVPGNAWSGLTLAVAQHYPDALPVPFDCTTVETPIGKFEWVDRKVMFTPIPLAEKITLTEPILPKEKK